MNRVVVVVVLETDMVEDMRVRLELVETRWELTWISSLMEVVGSISQDSGQEGQLSSHLFLFGKLLAPFQELWRSTNEAVFKHSLAVGMCHFLSVKAWLRLRMDFAWLPYVLTDTGFSERAWLLIARCATVTLKSRHALLARTLPGGYVANAAQRANRVAVAVCRLFVHRWAHD